MRLTVVWLIPVVSAIFRMEEQPYTFEEDISANATSIAGTHSFYKDGVPVDFPGTTLLLSLNRLIRFAINCSESAIYVRLPSHFHNFDYIILLFENKSIVAGRHLQSKYA